MTVLNSNSKIFVAGHNGMVGQAVLRRLQQAGYTNFLVRTRSELNLENQSAVNDLFKTERPEAVVFGAAKVGGIHANNSYPAEFIYSNLMMAANAIHAAYKFGTGRFLFLGSTCIYPRMAPQPINEDSLLSSQLEPTNEAYAIAKISGVKLCEFYRRQYGVTFHSAMPTNLYGPGDNYHPENSHVLPGLLRRFHEAKEQNQKTVAIWGSGTPLREFLHVDDLASGILHLLQMGTPPDLVNVGSGEEISIRELAEKVAETVGFEGNIELDSSKPDGTPRKLSDISKIKATGWVPKISLSTGLKSAYDSFISELGSQKLRSV